VSIAHVQKDVLVVLVIRCAKKNENTSFTQTVEHSLQPRLAERQFKALMSLCADQQKLEALPVDEFVALLVTD